MSKKIIISHPDTLKGFAAAYAAWYGLYVACPPDQERPEVEVAPGSHGPCPHCPSAKFDTSGEDAGSCVGTCPQNIDLHEICIFSAASEVWEQKVDGYPVPDVLRYVEDEALALPASKEVRAYLATVPRTAEGLLDFLNFDRQVAAFAGAAVLRSQAQGLQPLIDKYLETLPDYEDEWCTTEWSPAKYHLGEFTEWLEKRSGESKE